MTHVFSPDAADWSNPPEPGRARRLSDACEPRPSWWPGGSTRAERDARRQRKGERARDRERVRQRIRELKVSWTV